MSSGGLEIAQNIGNFEVTVLPDLKLFRSKIEAAARSMKIEIPVAFVLKPGEIAAIEAEAKKAKVKIRAEFDKDRLLAQLAELQAVAKVEVFDSEKLRLQKKQLAQMLLTIERMAERGADQLAIDKKIVAAEGKALEIGRQAARIAERELNTTEAQERSQRILNTLKTDLVAKAGALETVEDTVLETMRLEEGSLRDQIRLLAERAALGRSAVGDEIKLEQAYARLVKLRGRRLRMLPTEAETRGFADRLEGFRTNLRGIRNDLNAFDAFATRILKHIAVGFTAATAGVVATFGVIAAAGIHAFGQVEEAANKASSVFASGMVDAATVSTKSFLDLNDTIRAKVIATARQVGIATSFNAAEVSTGIEALAQAGVKLDSSLKGIGTVARFAQASGEDLITTSNLLVQGFIASGGAAEDFGSQVGKLADELTFAATDSAQSLKDILQGFQNDAGAAFHVFGQTVEETINALNLLGSAGIKGLKGGTSAAIVIRDIMKAAGEAPEVFKKYGVATTEADGTTRSFAAILDDLTRVFREQTDEFTKPQRFNALRKEFGFQLKSFRQLQTLLSTNATLQRKGSGAQKKLNELIAKSGGLLRLRAESVMTTFTQRFQQFRETVGALLSVFGAPAAHVLTKFFDQLVNGGDKSGAMFTRLRDKANEFGKVFARSLQKFLDQLTGPEGEAFFKGLVSGFKDTLSGVKAFFVEFDRAFSDGQARQKSFLEVLGDLAAAFGRFAKDVLPEVGKQLGKAFKFVQDHPDFFKGLARNFVGIAIASKAIKVAIIPLTSGLIGLVRALSGLRLGVVIGGMQGSSREAGFLARAIANITKVLSPLRATLVGVFVSLLPGIIKGFRDSINNQFGPHAWDGISKSTSGMAAALKDILGNAIKVVGEAFKAVGTVFAQVGAGIGHIIGGIAGALVGLGHLIAGIGHLLKGNFDEAKESFSGFINAIKSAGIEIIVRGLLIPILKLGVAIDRLKIAIAKFKHDKAGELIAKADKKALEDQIKSVDRWADHVQDAQRKVKDSGKKSSDSNRTLSDSLVSVGDSAAKAAGGVDKLKTSLTGTRNAIVNTFGGANITRSLRDNFASIADQAGTSVGRIASEYQAAVRIVREETGNLTNSLSAPQVLRALDLTEQTLNKEGIAVSGLGDDLRATALSAKGFGPALGSGIRQGMEAAKQGAAKGVRGVTGAIVREAHTGRVTVRRAGETAGQALNSGVVNAIDANVPKVVKATHGVVTKIAETGRTGVNTVRAAGTAVGAALNSSVINQINADIPKVQAAGTKSAQSLVDSVKNVLSKAKSGLISLGHSILAFFQDRTVTNLEKRLDAIKGTVSNLGEVLTAAKRAADTVTKTLITALRTYAPRLAASFSHAVMALGTVAIRSVRAISGTLKNAGLSVIRALQNGINKFARTVLYPAMRRVGAAAVKSVGEGAIKGVRVGKVVAALVATGVEIIKDIRDGMTKARPTIGEWGAHLISLVPHALALAVESIREALNFIGRRIVGHVRNGLSQGAPALYALAVAIGLHAGSLFKAGYATALIAGIRVMTGLRDGLQIGFVTLIQPKIHEITQWIKDNKGPIAYDRQLLQPAGVAIMAGLHDGLQDGFGEIKDFVSFLGPYVSDFVSEDLFLKRSATFLLGNAKMDKDFVADDYFADLIPDVLKLGLHPTLSLADTTAMAGRIAEFFHMGISSIFRPYDTVAGPGVSQHMLGQAADFAPGMSDRAASQLSLLIDKVFKQIIWRNSLWRGGKSGFGYVPNHQDHIHAGWVPGAGFSINSGRIGGTGAAGRREQGGQIIPRRPFMVGERGPELFVPAHNGQIVSAKDFKDLLNWLRQSAENRRQFADMGASPINWVTHIQSNSSDPQAVGAVVQANIRHQLEKVHR